jgi:hypothetical protein
VSGYAQEKEPLLGIEKLRLKINPEYDPWSPEQVYERVAEHLASVEGFIIGSLNPQTSEQLEKARQTAIYEIGFIRYFSLAEVPRSQLPAAIASLLFTVESASPSSMVTRLKPVSNTNNRLFWIDLRWLCWTPESFEKISLEDFYYREPLIPSESKALDFVRKRIGNGVIRGDWFTFYVGDTSQFLKVNENKADNAFYYTLLYSTNPTEVEVEKKVIKDYKYESVNAVWPGGPDANGIYYPKGTPYSYWQKSPIYTTKKVKEKRSGGVPKNEDEFLQFWGIDNQRKSLQFQSESGGVVDEGDSAVSWQNRIYVRRQALTGEFYRTYDVFVTAGDQDFLESLPVPPKKANAGELIFQSVKGAQYYLLVDGKNNRIEFGDPRIVHDQVSGKPFVLVTWKSCVQCHIDGIIAPKNEVPLMIKNGLDLRAKDPYQAQQIKSFYLRQLTKKIKASQEAYKDFILAVNGLTTEENALQYKQHRSWYAGPVTLSQAAREVGATPDEFSDAVSIGTKGRLGRLIMDGKAIPRTVWERGLFQEAFLLLIEYRKAVNVDRKQRGLPVVPTHSYRPPSTVKTKL